MKQVLTAIFIITASIATAEGEGRYIITYLDGARVMIVTDTKLGKVRVCNIISHTNVECSSWQSVRD